MDSRKKKALAALLSASTKQEAASAAGISYATLRRWIMEDADFRREYDAELQGIIESAAAQARQGIAEAVTTLREIMNDAEAAQNVKVTAARVILESGTRLIEMQAFESRLAALEAQLEGDNEK